jgi:hypothetical protein
MVIAAERFDALYMLGHSSAARIRQAELLDDRAAAPIRERAITWFSAERIANPAGWVRMYAPVD